MEIHLTEEGERLLAGHVFPVLEACGEKAESVPGHLQAVQSRGSPEGQEQAPSQAGLSLLRPLCGTVPKEEDVSTTEKIPGWSPSQAPLLAVVGVLSA